MLATPDITALPHPPLVPPEAGDTLARHYLSLGPRSRRLRFMAGVDDTSLAGLAGRARPDELIVLRIDGSVRGVLEIFETGNGHAEIGLSIEDAYQGLGLGRTLFARGLEVARSRGIRTADLMFAAENTGVRHLVLAHGGRVRVRGSECEAEIVLAPERQMPDLASHGVARICEKRNAEGDCDDRSMDTARLEDRRIGQFRRENE